MELHRVSLKLHKNYPESSMELSRNFMEFHGSFMELCRTLWGIPMELHMPIFYGEILWKILWIFPLGLGCKNKEGSI
jgi:hypothetical protein